MIFWNNTLIPNQVMILGVKFAPREAQSFTVYSLHIMSLFFKISSRSGIVHNTKGICNDLSAFYFWSECCVFLISYIFSAYLDTVSFIVKVVKKCFTPFLFYSMIIYFTSCTVHFCLYNLQIKGYCQVIHFKCSSLYHL